MHVTVKDMLQMLKQCENIYKTSEKPLIMPWNVSPNFMALDRSHKVT